MYRSWFIVDMVMRATKVGTLVTQSSKTNLSRTCGSGLHMTRKSKMSPSPTWVFGYQSSNATST